MKHGTYIEINGIRLSPRFLVMINGRWMRKCRRCAKPLPPTTEHFHVKGTPSSRMLDRTCKMCRDNAANRGVARTCSECGLTKPATTKNFRDNRGILLFECKACWNKRSKVYTRQWQKRNPRKCWETGVRSSAKARARRRGLSYDEDAVNEVIAAHVDGSVCPCCHKPMIGKDRWASLDRLNSSIGYERGNIGFICYRCNWVKNNGTLEELQNVAAYMLTKTDPSSCCQTTAAVQHPLGQRLDVQELIP